jgi:starch-binding outer membrane protein, SusD/RagB family
MNNQISISRKLLYKKGPMRILKIFLITTGLMFTMGCEKDYLDVDPIDRYVYYNYLENEAQVEQALTGCYRKVFPIANTYLWQFGEMLSDNTSFYYNPTDRGGASLEQVDEFVSTADNSAYNGMYQESYEGIQRSNYVLEGLEKVRFVSDSIRNVRVGEATFFRAWHYFNLVRLYGDQPIIKKVITNPNESKVQVRSAASEVYAQVIIPDALSAIDKLPKSVLTTQRGRLTKGAALMLLSKVYMTQKKFSEAIPLLEQIKQLGYSLRPNYAENFDPTKKNGTESIFEVQAGDNSGYNFGFGGSWTPWGSGAVIWPGGSNSRGGVNQPTKDLNLAYERADTLRRNSTIGRWLKSGVGMNPPDTILYMSKFLFWDAALRANPSNFPIYRYSDALLMLAECQNEINFPNSQAFINLNEVRKRAKLADKTQSNSNPSLAINSQTDFRIAIEKERQVELAGEGHRWFDIVRTGRAEEIMKSHGSREKLNKINIDKSAYSNIRLILPIPFREIQQFGYAQNLGW